MKMVSLKIKKRFPMKKDDDKDKDFGYQFGTMSHIIFVLALLPVLIPYLVLYNLKDRVSNWWNNKVPKCSECGHKKSSHNYNQEWSDCNECYSCGGGGR